LSDPKSPFGFDIEEFMKHINQTRSSDVGIKIQKHIFECKLCQTLSAIIGLTIEAHMKEKEDLNKLV